MLKICVDHEITYVNKYAQGCPVCHLHKLLVANEQEIWELKAEVHRQAMELGNPTLIPVINQELLEASQELLSALDDCPGDFRYSVEVEDRARAAVAHAQGKIIWEPEKEK